MKVADQGSHEPGTEFQFKSPDTAVILTHDQIVFRRGKHDVHIHKMMRGDTTVRYSEILGIKFSEPTMTAPGYLQFNTPRTSILGLVRTEDQPQNAVRFKKNRLQYALAVRSYVEARMADLRSSSPSAPQQPVELLRQFKQLLDEGLISADEFEVKRRQILGL